MENISRIKENRRAARVQVDFLLNKFIKGRPYICKATNLSHSGLFVQKVHEPLSEEQQVGLQFMLPNSERIITCAGRVVRGKGKAEASGIRFTSISPEHQKIIDEFIEGELARIAGW